MVHILRATIEHLDDLTRLFDGYRSFYKQPSDITAGRAFLQARIEERQSVIFLAFDDERAVGFVQLYPLFSSVSLQSMYVLNDLYVEPLGRGRGIGAALLSEAQGFAKRNALKGLTLETAIDNPAQSLYERLGWKRDKAFYHYFWKNDD